LSIEYSVLSIELVHLRLQQELQYHAELIADLKTLGQDLADEAGLSTPPNVIEMMLSYPGFVVGFHDFLLTQ
jgi:hypothetical protein